MILDNVDASDLFITIMAAILAANFFTALFSGMFAFLLHQMGIARHDD